MSADHFLPLVLFLGGGCIPTPDPSSGNVRNVCFFSLESPLVGDCPMPSTVETTGFDENKCESALLAACTQSDTTKLYDDAFCPLEFGASEPPPCDELRAITKRCFADAGVTASCSTALQEQIALLGPNPDAG